MQLEITRWLDNVEQRNFSDHASRSSTFSFIDMNALPEADGEGMHGRQLSGRAEHVNTGFQPHGPTKQKALIDRQPDPSD